MAQLSSIVQPQELYNTKNVQPIGPSIVQLQEWCGYNPYNGTALTIVHPQELNSP